MKIYISIPISGHNLAVQQRKANEAAKKLREMGHEPVNPFDTIAPPGGLREDERYAYYMGEDLKKLLMCDAILMCSGWGASKGCAVEHQVARIYSIKTIYGLQGVPRK